MKYLNPFERVNTSRISVKLGVATFLIFFQFLAFTIKGQGFYNHQRVFINTEELAIQGICKVNAYSDYKDVSNRKLENFVFCYYIDNNGDVNKRKQWDTRFKSRKFLWWSWQDERCLVVKLVLDSAATFDSVNTFFKPFKESETIEFDPYSKMLEDIIDENLKIIEKGGWHSVISIPYWGRDYIALVDTTILGINIRSPKFLLHETDSLQISPDSVVTWTFYGNYKHRFTVTDSVTLRVDWFSEGRPWRVYLFNKNGQLTKTVQNIHTTKYYYENRLHIKTEIYQKEYLVETTIFEYQKHCGE